jgi:hypothetical protein
LAPVAQADGAILQEVGLMVHLVPDQVSMFMKLSAAAAEAAAAPR